MVAAADSADRMRARAVPGTWLAFVVAACVAIVIDNAPYPRILWDAWFSQAAIEDPTATLARTTWVAVAVWVLLRPSSTLRYALLCIVGASVIVSRVPTIPNHWMLELAIFVGSLAMLATTRNPAERLRGIRALVLGSILAVYVWTFVHKLNWGFLDPEVGCGAIFLDSLSERLRLPPPHDFVRRAAAYIVLVAEGLMPLVLLGARTRSFAIVLGLGLHFMFGLFVAGFSLLMWATYFLLLPDAALDPVVQRTSKLGARLLRTLPKSSHIRRTPGWLRQVVAFAALGFAVLLIKDVPRLRGLTQQETLLLPLSVVLGALLVSGILHSRMRLPLERPARPVMTLAVLFPLVLFANGALPYIGVRNTLAFSMFSNLRTEGGASNHLFLPSMNTPFSVLDDQIQILDSSDPVLQHYARPLPRRSLRRSR